MLKQLNNKKVAILVANGFEQVELTQPKQALEDAGAETYTISPNEETVKGWQFTNWGDEFPVDVQIDNTNASHFDALLLPGGVMNPDKLRRSEKVVRFVQDFFADEKPVAAICHGPWTLIEAGVVKGRKMTSFHSIKTDLINAGVEWTDQEVVIDRNLLTSRNPDDIPAFNQQMIELFAGTGAAKELQTA
jgi:protease I